MTIDEAIKHAEEVAENKEKAIKLAKGNPDHPMLSMSEKEITEYKKCINEHRQLAEWLKDYKRLLEQESCDDVVSRQTVLDQTYLWSKDEFLRVTNPFDYLRKRIKALPSVNPQEPKTDWIPVSERLPEKPNIYTVTDSKGDVVRFVFNDTESSRDYWLRCVKAWMPLPKPYDPRESKE